VFGDNNHHDELGGLKRMGDQMKNGMVLVMSLWDDHDANMLWLDSNYPLDKDPSIPGVDRGPCPIDSGTPEDMEANYPDSTVVFSKIRVGDLDSTY
jgi:cellulose 1,4-beta-cellobiosidase